MILIKYFYIDDENDIEQENTEEVVDEEQSDEENFSLETSGFDIDGPISFSQLLAKRNEVLNKAKIHIGTLSAGLLENPEEKVTNLRTLLSMLDEETAEMYSSIRKIIVVSLLEVFKDILPSYEIKSVQSDGVKRK